MQVFDCLSPTLKVLPGSAVTCQTKPRLWPKRNNSLLVVFFFNPPALPLHAAWAVFSHSEAAGEMASRVMPQMANRFQQEEKPFPAIVLSLFSLTFWSKLVVVLWSSALCSCSFGISWNSSALLDSFSDCLSLHSPDATASESIYICCSATPKERLEWKPVDVIKGTWAISIILKTTFRFWCISLPSICALCSPFDWAGFFSG